MSGTRADAKKRLEAERLLLQRPQCLQNPPVYRWAEYVYLQAVLTQAPWSCMTDDLLNANSEVEALRSVVRELAECDIHHSNWYGLRERARAALVQEQTETPRPNTMPLDCPGGADCRCGDVREQTEEEQ